MGYATICGLSNISFGLPERGYVNSVFLTMAIKEGLTMAIANPSQELLVSSAFAADLLLAKPESDIRYIGKMNDRGDKAQTQDAVLQEKEKASPKEEAAYKVKEDVLKGNRKKIVEDTKKALEWGIQPVEILDDCLLPAINEVGDFFDKGKYFLPQLIAGA